MWSLQKGFKFVLNILKNEFITSVMALTATKTASFLLCGDFFFLLGYLFLAVVSPFEGCCREPMDYLAKPFPFHAHPLLLLSGIS